MMNALSVISSSQDASLQMRHPKMNYLKMRPEDASMPVCATTNYQNLAQ